MTSPNGKLEFSIILENRRLSYQVSAVDAGKKVPIIGDSPLGLDMADEDFSSALWFVEATPQHTVRERYTMATGKRSECAYQANQRVFRFRNAKGTLFDLQVHVADDGTAFRYALPGSADEPMRVVAEKTGFRIPEGAKSWIAPCSKYSKWTPAYEEFYTNGTPAGQDAPGEPGWTFPALFQLSSGWWCLVTESGTDGTYCGCRLAAKVEDGLYRVRFPAPEEGWGQGDVYPVIQLPWKSPWRVLIIGAKPSVIVESTLVTDLAPSSRVDDTSWIKPGRVSWSWWSDHDSPQDFDKLKTFVDLAAEMGWEYSLVDANWTLMSGGNVRDLAKYAQSKGVRLLLWYNSGGEHNIVTEKPRGAMKSREVRLFEFDLLQQWGVAGVKIDFFQSDKQNIIQLYHDILQDAAEKHILVNFHGCTIPRGWQRTWPHLMSMEAVKGAECYTFAADFPSNAPVHNTILPFTRNAIGSMDYTPVAFSDDRYPHITTNAHELALSVVFESGWLHFADSVEAYRSLPDAPKQFLKTVPVTWDETRLLAGSPGDYVVIARRKGERWCIGAINGRNEAKDISLTLSLAPEGEWKAVWIGDGESDREFAVKRGILRDGDELRLKLRPFGGAVVDLQP
ncbi:glycoside hydrolase family 97 protein [Thermostilla marina]